MFHDKIKTIYLDINILTIYYVGYWAWFLAIEAEGWGDDNTTNGSRWNQNRSGMRSKPPWFIFLGIGY